MSKYALLIGIDRYDSIHVPEALRSKDANVTSIKLHDLGGAVNDVLKMRKFLIESLAIPKENIKTLIAPVKTRDATDYPYLDKTETETDDPELRDQVLEPTYQNIVIQLQQLATEAKTGDLVYVHYSGHGMRAKTAFREFKISKTSSQAQEPMDECIVPCDFVQTGKLLRDIELGALLQDIADGPDEPTLTVVLDCCHSGGALRGDDDDEERGVRFIAEEYLSDQSDAHIEGSSLQESVRKWKDVGLWDESPKGFVVLVACFDYQKAPEQDFGKLPRVRHGCLSYWLLETISQYRTRSLAAGSIHDAVRANMVASVLMQEPYVIGDSTRSFFDKQLSNWVPRPYITKITKDDTKRPEACSVTISAGSAHGVSCNSVYAILSQQEEAPDSKAQGLARVRVTTVRSECCIATFLEIPDWDKIRVGCPTMLLDLDGDFRQKVLLRNFSNEQLDKFIGHWRGDKNMFETRVRNILQLVVPPDSWNHLPEQSKSLIHELRDEKTAPLAISIVNNEYCIEKLLDRFSEMDRLRCDVDDDFHILTDRLQHLARFILVRDLKNRFKSKDLDMVSVSVQLSPGLEEEQDKDGQIIYNGFEQTEFEIKIKNNSPSQIAFVILNLGLGLGCQIIHPFDSEPFTLLKSGDHFVDIFKIKIPEDVRGSKSVQRDGGGLPELVKVFLTTSHNKDFRSLQLQPLAGKKRGARSSDDALEAWGDAALDQVLQYFGPPSRDVERVVPSAWKTIDLHFKTRMR